MSKEIEQEVQARVEFKMNEFITGLKNIAKRHWHIAFQTMDSKYQHYWEAFEQIEQMIQKEIRMGTPYDDMANRKKWEAKQKAVENISNSLQLKGRDADHKIRIIVREVESAQNF